MATFFGKAQSRLAGKSFTSLFFIEVFCGTGRLTASIRKLGLHDAFGIDHIMHQKLRSPAITLDLTTPQGVQLFHECLMHEHLAWVHFAPPCGTSSRARNIKKPGRYNPPPLRSDAEPDGMRNIPTQFRARAGAANKLYAVTSEAIEICHSQGVFWSAENPIRSFMWQTSHWNSKTSHLPYLNLCLDHCMFGGERQKRTRISHVIPAFRALEVYCDGRHDHLPWGVTTSGWATAEETAYPMQLCRAMADAFLQQVLSMGVIPPPISLSSHMETDDSKFSQALGGKQPRGKKIPPLISEFKTVVELIGPSTVMPVGKMTTDWLIPTEVTSNSAYTALPAGSRVVRSQPYQRGVEQKTSNSFEVHGANLNDIDTTTLMHGLNSFSNQKPTTAAKSKCIVGIPWSPDEFLRQASDNARHPHRLIDGVPGDLRTCIEYRANETDADVGRERTATMRKWMLKLVDCMDEEKEMKKSFSAHRANILASKRLVVFRRLLEEVDHPDIGIVDDIENGFDLVGPIPKSGIYRKRVRAASLTVGDLRSSAKRVRRAIVHSTVGSGDDAIDLGVYQSTLEEMNRGWLHGPYKEEDLPNDCTVTRRFGVRQGAKIRPIDNYTESLVNQTTSAGESISLHSTDVIAAALAFWMDKKKHSSLSTGPELLGKSYDLHKAYKHLCISDESLKDGYICVYNPGKKQPEIFGQYVLPFGACASVHGFCRTSFGLWTIGVRLLKLFWTVYFDDFILFETPPLSTHCELVVSTFFKMLGWATSVDKENKFDTSLKALGVVIDLSDIKLLRVKFGNSDERKFEVCRDLDNVLAMGELGKSEGQRLRGRLLFAESQINGRRSVRCMQLLSKHIHQNKTPALGPETIAALKFFKEKLSSGDERIVTPMASDIVHIYCDASYEPDTVNPVGIGCFLLDLKSGFRAHVSEFIQQSDVGTWNLSGSKHPIYEFELLAIVVALKAFRPYATGKSIVVFTDNEGALGSLIRCKSDNAYGMAIIELICKLEENMQSFVWYERVNTASNIADIPSRTSELDDRFGSRINFKLDAILDEITMDDMPSPFKVGGK